MTVNIGDIFDTPYERGCLCTSAPEPDGGFEGVDSDGVACGFVVEMVIRIVAGRDGS